MWKKFILLAAVTAMSLTGAALAAAAAPAPPSPAKVTTMLKHTKGAVFPVGTYNASNVHHFTGDSYVAPLSQGKVPVANVTFVNGAHTYWHVHHGTSQTLLAVSGKGYYQIAGQAPRVLLPGQSVTIPEGVRHWHGAAPGQMFQHIAVMEPVQGAWTEWFIPVDEQLFQSLS